jgi:hypothetical protein
MVLQQWHCQHWQYIGDIEIADIYSADIHSLLKFYNILVEMPFE